MKPHFLLVLLAAISLSACSKPTYQGTSLAYNQDFDVVIGEQDKETGEYGTLVERKGGREWMGEGLNGGEECQPARQEALMNIAKMEAAKICVNGDVPEFVGEPDYATNTNDNYMAAGGGLLGLALNSMMMGDDGPFGLRTSFKCVPANANTALTSY